MFKEATLLSDVDLVGMIFQQAEIDIKNAMDGKNLWRDGDRHQMLGQVRTILKELEVESLDKSVPLIEEYHGEAVKEATQTLGKVENGINTQLIDKTIVEYIVQSLPDIVSTHKAEVRNLLNTTYASLESSLNLVKKELRQEMLTKIGTGQVAGKSRKYLERELIKRMKDANLTSIKIPSTKTASGEISISLKTYAHGLTQSALISARASAVLESAINRGYDLIQISTHSKPSPMCARWQGQIVSISGKDNRYPKITEALFNGDYKRGGCFHRYCRHTLYVHIETDIKFV